LGTLVVGPAIAVSGIALAITVAALPNKTCRLETSAVIARSLKSPVAGGPEARLVCKVPLLLRSYPSEPYRSLRFFC
jgi:hypothetical protein